MGLCVRSGVASYRSSWSSLLTRRLTLRPESFRALCRGCAAKYALYFLLELVALLGAFKIMTRVFERKPLGMVGLAFHPAWGKELCTGLGIGAIMMVLVGAVEGMLALARFAWSPVPATSELAYGGATFLILFISATNEELVFRGYPFQKLVESLGASRERSHWLRFASA